MVQNMLYMRLWLWLVLMLMLLLLMLLLLMWLRLRRFGLHVVDHLALEFLIWIHAAIRVHVYELVVVLVVLSRLFAFALLVLALSVLTFRRVAVVRLGHAHGGCALLVLVEAVVGGLGRVGLRLRVRLRRRADVVRLLLDALHDALTVPARATGAPRETQFGALGTAGPRYISAADGQVLLGMDLVGRHRHLHMVGVGSVKKNHLLPYLHHRILDVAHVVPTSKKEGINTEQNAYTYIEGDNECVWPSDTL